MKKGPQLGSFFVSHSLENDEAWSYKQNTANLLGRPNKSEEGTGRVRVGMTAYVSLKESEVNVALFNLT